MNSEIAKSRIGEVIRIDTVTSTQADFLATHVPVQNIHIRKKWDSKTDKIMSEEKVFNKYVLNTENEHQFIIVIGSSGAGKSHLIRWFAARLEQAAPENEVVLFVRRSDNSLKGTNYSNCRKLPIYRIRLCMTGWFEQLQRLTIRSLKI